MQIIDSHCHINFPDYKDRLGEILENAQKNDVTHMLCISTTWENAPEVLTLAQQHPQIYASVGIHPCTTEGHEPEISELVDKASSTDIVAVGETGLDYHWHEGDLDWQHQRFQRHIAAARQVDKPLIIHTRSAAEDTINTLVEHKAADCGGVMHCFAENWDIAKRALDIGFYISFSGIVTFKNATEVHEVAKKTPADRILVETDAPFLAPVPYRGKQNQPAYVRHTAEQVANLRNTSIEDIAATTTENFFNLFSSAKSPAS